MKTLRRLASAGIDLLYPPACALCKSPFDRTLPLPAFGLCSPCTEPLIPIDRPFCETCGEPYENASDKPFSCSNCRGQDYGFEFAIAAYRNRNTVHDLIVGLKYLNQFELSHPLAQLLARTLDDPRLANWNPTLVPVPLHSSRMRTRGYNQAKEIAIRLAKSHGLPVSNCLIRSKPTPSQTHLNRAARLENLENAFEVKKNRSFPENDILLVDDVFTTGATATACSRPLLEAGASRIAVITVARS